MPWALTETLKFVQQINSPSFCCVLIKPFVEEPLLLVFNILVTRASSTIDGGVFDLGPASQRCD
jgi:hypothetical protein